MIEGRLFSRDPKSGLKRLSGSVLLDPKSPTELPLFCLQQRYPQIVVQLEGLVAAREREHGGAVQCRFQVVDEQAVLTEVEDLKCSVEAKLRILKDLVEEGSLTCGQALERLEPFDLRQCPQISKRDVHRLKNEGRLMAEGSGNGLGIAAGYLAFDAESAWKIHARNKPVLLITQRLDLGSKDALEVCQGVLSSEPAPWFREKPLLVIPALDNLQPDRDYILDSTHHKLWRGCVEPEMAPGETALAPIRSWLRSVGGLDVRCNLSSVDEAESLAGSDVHSVGLCRAELFFQSSPQRLEVLREALNGAIAGEKSGTDAMAAVIAADVERLLKALSPHRDAVLTLRFFDAPLSRMLTLWTRYLGVTREQLHDFLWGLLEERNSTQGLRGGRFSLLFPAFFEAQVRGAGLALKRTGEKGRLQLMLPGVSTVEEVRFFHRRADSVFRSLELEPPCFGMMLETPRACLLADRFVEDCDFFSFGTGDLTESVFALSRYDAPLSFLAEFLDASGLSEDPFKRLDSTGVGELMALACQKIRAHSDDVEIGWCGAQAVHGVPNDLWERLNLDYVSVPLNSVEATRLSAFQSSLGLHAPSENTNP